MNACKSLVRYALKHGYMVSVFDGEEWSTKKSRDYAAIMSDISGVEEAQLVFRTAEGEKNGWALVSLYGLDPEETVIDHTTKGICAQWDQEINGNQWEG